YFFQPGKRGSQNILAYVYHALSKFDQPIWISDGKLVGNIGYDNEQNPGFWSVNCTVPKEGHIVCQNCQRLYDIIRSSWRAEKKRAQSSDYKRPKPRMWY